MSCLESFQAEKVSFNSCGRFGQLPPLCQHPVWAVWAAVALVFLVLWPTKWAQYLLLVLPPLSVCAGMGVGIFLGLLTSALGPARAGAAACARAVVSGCPSCAPSGPSRSRPWRGRSRQRARLRAVAWP
jgi:hypothetical protein